MQQHSNVNSILSSGTARRDAEVLTLHVGRQAGLFTEGWRSSADTCNTFIYVNITELICTLTQGHMS